MAIIFARTIYKSQSFVCSHFHSFIVSPNYRLNGVANLSSWADMGQSLSSSATVHLAKTNLINLHEWTHLPWFAEIALVTLAARFLVTFPLSINQRKIMNRYEALKPEILNIKNKLGSKLKMNQYAHNLSPQKAQAIYSKALTKEINRLIVRDNCHPIKGAIVPLFQIPIWVILSQSYRNLAKVLPDPSDPVALHAYSQLQHEGLLWFHDLTVPDPTGLLPIATAIVNLSIIQLYVNQRKRNNLKDSTFVKVITNASRVFSLVIIPIGLFMPANMSFYWFVSSSIGLFQNALLMKPQVKTFFKIKTPTEIECKK